MSTEETPDSTRHNRRGQLVVTSVAAAVLLAGGGGAYWASTASNGGSDSGGTAGDAGRPPPLALDGAAASGSGGPSGSEGIAPGEPNPYGVTYRAAGPLPDGPDSAPVYRPAGEVRGAEVARLAKALKVKGEPRLEGMTWKVGEAQGSKGRGPELQVGKDAPGRWAYTPHGTPAGDGCVHPEGDAATGSADGDCPSFRGGPSGGTSGDGGSKPVSEKAAKRAAAPVLKALGQQDAKLSASGHTGAVRIVSADPKVNGLPTYGWQTGVQVGSEGRLTGGSGQLASLRKGAEYPVLSAQQTLANLNKVGEVKGGKAEGSGKPGIGGCASAVPHTDSGKSDSDKSGTADGSEADEQGGPETLPARQPCESPAKPEPATVRGAVFGLASTFVSGRPALVPSWIYEVQPAGAKGSGSTLTVTHPAVDPEFIARPKPSSEPTSPPSSGSGSGSAGPASGAQDITSYSSDGKDAKMLKVTFWGGVCSDYSASVDESAGSVKVEVTGKEKKPGRNCIMIAKEFTKKVTLDKSLADRKVVDETTGKSVPKTVPKK
ncbi:hypothetical protein [Streptomyces sp. H27-D2]|uniref:hypothetical protein n=1 Tax=Streptomyces sp. H27-D2 TaxID=3046304 RepID=UPI002DB816E6|nr:hypothetical protein [Streptomyces sp. H27-D2]MEC4019335.1 hypothetical protein [Streptomyces sp. H27-D2]